LLTDISEPTGGRHFVVENLNELPDVAAKIGIELRNQYVLGYSPSNQTRDGKYRKVKCQTGTAEGIASPARILENRLLCADAITSF
jgi:Ca-activated chloride channel homolog